MTLIALARNPVPSGAVAGLIQGYDGTPLRYARWAATTTHTRGTVVVIPGRAEFIEKYFETVADLRRRGFAVAIMDLRGQGGSKRVLGHPLKGHVRNFREYDYDLTLFIKDVVMPNCPPPYLALGHSLGGHVVMRAAGLADCPFERLIVTAPMIRIAPQQLNMPCGVARALAEIIAGVGFSGMTPPGVPMEPLWAQPFEKNELTSSRERFERATLVLEAAPELAVGPPTFGWLRAAFRSCAMLAALASMPTTCARGQRIA